MNQTIVVPSLQVSPPTTPTKITPTIPKKSKPISMKGFYSVTKEIDHSKDLVVLSGWMACSPSIFKKYIDLWLNRGFNAYAFPGLMDPSMVIVTQRAKKNLKRVAKYLQAHTECQNLYFHGFSNGGGYTTACMFQEIDDYYPFMRPMVKGVFFDSLPSITKRGVGNAFKQALLNHGTALVKPFVAFKPLLNGRWFTLLDRTVPKLLTMKCNYVVVFSKDDDIIDYKEVEEFTSRLKECAGEKNVLVKFYENGGHVSHLRLYKQEYEDMLDKLLLAASKNLSICDNN
ncbi:hypothetical protein CYY_002860 [Polysphondylium violaceum]|uniref:Uncharacterized protein n=1 Tax=Polysphondylium violaceum TaxID=133409 RepID=A0A8J4UUS1_9MYCE|nr:hypothetical protein CYY_002860 [Polysphondylium violaceum]